MKQIIRGKFHLSFFLRTTLILLLLSPFLISNSFQAIATPIEPGIVVNYKVFLNRELTNGDVVGIDGEIQILFISKPNSTHIVGNLNAVIDLAWIEGRQVINFTQRLNDRLLYLDNFEGSIIDEVLLYFGYAEDFYNPIYIDGESLGNSTVKIWGYEAHKLGTRQLIWNYYKLSVYDYKIIEDSRDLIIDASYHQDTGLLIGSTVDFTQKISPTESIHNLLRIFLTFTNIKIEGEREFNTLYFFIGFAFVMVLIPIIISIWIFRKNKSF